MGDNSTSSTPGIVRIRTTMIGAIAAIENQFQYLWENDEVLKEKFNELRKTILDLGNKQIRLFKEEKDGK